MLLDTSGLYCFLDAGEQRHADAVTYFHSATIRVTHSYVLAELVALAQARGLRRETVLAFALDLLDNPAVEMLWVSSEQYRTAVTFLQARTDKTYSLCDAISFLVMQERGILEALTTDHHFEQAGFRKLL